VDQFGASAPGETVMSQYGFSPENVVKKTFEILMDN
jgi:transketolase